MAQITLAAGLPEAGLFGDYDAIAQLHAAPASLATQARPGPGAARAALGAVSDEDLFAGLQ